jgi:exonuclease V
MPENGGVLQKLRKSSISVTDIANQFWCERQMEYNYMYGKKYTKYMERGKQLHEMLQNEVYVPLTIEPVTYADVMYKISYENYGSLLSLVQKGVCRELSVHGSVNGYKISGKIDEMRVEAGRSVVIERKTTDARRQLSEAYTRPHRVQVMLYRKLLGDITSGAYGHSNFVKSYGIGHDGISDTFKRELRAMGVKDELLDAYSISGLVFEMFRKIPGLSDRLEVIYMDRFSGKEISRIKIDYDASMMQGMLMQAMGFWRGERHAEPVPEAEKWKCNFCKFFGNECKAWWEGR